MASLCTRFVVSAARRNISYSAARTCKGKCSRMDGGGVSGQPKATMKAAVVSRVVWGYVM